MNRSLCSENSQCSLLGLLQMLLQRLSIHTFGTNYIHKITFYLCKKHAHQCIVLERSKTMKVPSPNFSPSLQQCLVFKQHKTSWGLWLFFFLLFHLQVHKIADLRSLSCLLTAHLPTSCAPPLKSVNQTPDMLYFTLHDRDQREQQDQQVFASILLVPLPSMQCCSLRSKGYQLRVNAKCFYRLGFQGNSKIFARLCKPDKIAQMNRTMTPLSCSLKNCFTL